MEFIRRNIKFVYILVLPVYFYIIQSSILNKHSHFYSNGLVVTHSHIIDSENDNPINDHDHTQTEICLYCDLNIDLHTVYNQVAIDFSISVKQKILFVEQNHFDYSTSIAQIAPRGPPFRMV